MAKPARRSPEGATREPQDPEQACQRGDGVRVAGRLWGVWQGQTSVMSCGVSDSITREGESRGEPRNPGSKLQPSAARVPGVETAPDPPPDWNFRSTFPKPTATATVSEALFTDFVSLIYQ